MAQPQERCDHQQLALDQHHQIRTNQIHQTCMPDHHLWIVFEGSPQWLLGHHETSPWYQTSALHKEACHLKATKQACVWMEQAHRLEACLRTTLLQKPQQA